MSALDRSFDLGARLGRSRTYSINLALVGVSWGLVEPPFDEDSFAGALERVQGILVELSRVKDGEMGGKRGCGAGCGYVSASTCRQPSAA